MIPLNNKEYRKIIEPLKSVSINTLFARSVIDQKVNGKVYVDDAENPRTFYVLHPYGMSLLFGDCNNEAFNLKFKEYVLNLDQKRDKDEWMQAFPAGWNPVLNSLFENHQNSVVEIDTRVNFKFNEKKYLDRKNNNLPEIGIKIVPVTEEIFENMKGTVVPSNFWNTADDFVKNGIGYAACYENELASTAFSAFIEKNELELGIETLEQFKGKAFAYEACSALIEYCLKRNLEPIWACRLGNTGSYKLAQKLGFEVSKEIPYYRLKINHQPE